MSGQPYQKAADFAVCRLRWGRTRFFGVGVAASTGAAFATPSTVTSSFLAAATTFGQPE